MSASVRISRKTALDLALLLVDMGHIGSGGRVFDASKLRAQLVAALFATPAEAPPISNYRETPESKITTPESKQTETWRGRQGDPAYQALVAQKQIEHMQGELDEARAEIADHATERELAEEKWEKRLEVERAQAERAREGWAKAVGERDVLKRELETEAVIKEAFYNQRNQLETERDQLRKELEEALRNLETSKRNSDTWMGERDALRVELHVLRREHAAALAKAASESRAETLEEAAQIVEYAIGGPLVGPGATRGTLYRIVDKLRARSTEIKAAGVEPKKEPGEPSAADKLVDPYMAKLFADPRPTETAACHCPPPWAVPGTVVVHFNDCPEAVKKGQP